MTGATRKTVLLADDLTTAREELRDAFQRSGLMVVAEARNTDDALDRFERLWPDVVIMDVTLLGSLDALVAIQRIHRLKPETIILATGTGSQSAALMEALSMGAVDFFLKPFQKQSVRLCFERNVG